MKVLSVNTTDVITTVEWSQKIYPQIWHLGKQIIVYPAPWRTHEYYFWNVPVILRNVRCAYLDEEICFLMKMIKGFYLFQWLESLPQ